ncbi:MAG: pilus assembly protein PilM [Candidatus Gracilibacteria bacterium]
MINPFLHIGVGVEFHDQWVQIVELRKRGKTISLEAFERMPVPLGLIENGEIKDPEALKTVLNQTFENANPRAISRKHIAVILPSRAVFIHIFKLPTKLSPKDVHQAISYEAENIVPFALEDLYWDYRILDKEDSTKEHASQYVLFAGVQKILADGYASLLESMGIHSELFGISIDALLQIITPDLEDNGNNAAISFGPLSTQICFMEGKKLRSFFSSNDGYEKFMHSLQEEHQCSEEDFRKKWEENALDQTQLKELINFIERNYDHLKTLSTENNPEPLSELFLAGEYASLPVFYGLARSSFPKTKIVIGDPKKSLEVDGKKFSSKQCEKGGKIPLSIYFTNAIGMALAVLRKDLFTPLNLLPTHIKSQLKQRRLDVLGSGISIALTLIGIVIMGFLFIKLQDVSFERSRMETKMHAVENTLYGTRYQDIKQLFSAFNDQLTTLSEIEASLFSLPTFIETIYAELPPGITPTTLGFKDNELQLEMSGIALTREDLLELQKILKANSAIKTVELPLSNFDEKNNISFTVTLSLNFSQLPPYGNSTK